MGSVIGGLGKAVTGFLGAGGSAPQIQTPSFPTIRSSSFLFNPQSGIIGRRGGTLGQSRLARLVPQREAAILGLDPAGNPIPSVFDQARAGLPGLTGQVADIRNQFGPLRETAQGFFGRTAPLEGRLTQQLDELRPGFGRLTEARVNAVRSATGRAIGGARSAFQQRNILGSNFAQQAISSIQQEGGRQEDLTRAEAFVQEQEAQRQIIGQIGNLVTLDQQSLANNLGVLAAELGLTEADRVILQQGLEITRQELAALQQRTSRELAELGVAANTISQVQRLQAATAIEQAKLDADNAKAAGQSLSSGFAALGGLVGGLGGIFGGSVPGAGIVGFNPGVGLSGRDPSGSLIRGSTGILGGGV